MLLSVKFESGLTVSHNISTTPAGSSGTVKKVGELHNYRIASPAPAGLSGR
jgi:hypothetical protein